MNLKIKAVVAALAFMAASGADFGGRADLAAANWAGLSADQREMIDLVAQDIWTTEQRGGAIAYRELGVREKNALRAEAMHRLGFTPRPVSGVEA